MADWLKSKRITDYLMPYRLAFLINGCFLLLFLISGTMKYETSDDFLMEMIVSGGYSGEPSPFVMFMNPLIGICLSFCYRMLLGINWFFYFQLLWIYLSMSVITVQLYKKRLDAVSVLFSVVFISFFSHDLYQLMQFTKTAMITLACGELLVLKNIIKADWNKKEIGIGFLFICIGTMIRRTCLYLAIAFAAVQLGLWLWTQFRQGKIEFALKRIGVCLCMLAVVFGLVWGSSNAYDDVHPEYARYKEYQALRSNIIDYQPPAYEDIASDLQKINISKNDYYNLILFQIGDQSVYTREKLEQIAELAKDYKKDLSFSDIKQEISERHYEHYLCVLGVLLLGVLVCVFKKNTMIILLGQSCVALVLLAHLYVQRRVVYRAEFIIFLTMAVSILVVYIIYEDRTKLINDWKKLLHKCCILFSGGLLLLSAPSFIPRHTYGFTAMFYSWENHLSKYRVSFQRNKQQALLQEFADHPDHIYFLGFQSTIQSIYLNFDPRLAQQADSLFKNAVYLGGVSYFHPSHSDWLSKHCLSEKMRELLRDNVYLVENNYEEVYLKFVQEHYDKDAKMKLVKEIDGYQIWKIYV